MRRARPVAMSVYRIDREDDPTRFGLKVFSRGAPLSLSYRVPVIENHGLRVVNERTYQIMPSATPAPAPSADAAPKPAENTQLRDSIQKPIDKAKSADDIQKKADEEQRKDQRSDHEGARARYSTPDAPPSRLMLVPVTKLAASDARNAITFATSSARPTRPSGMSSTIRA